MPVLAAAAAKMTEKCLLFNYRAKIIKSWYTILQWSMVISAVLTLGEF